MRALLAVLVTLAVGAGTLWYMGAFEGDEKAVVANVTTGSPQDHVNARIERMNAMAKAMSEVSKASAAGDISGQSDNALVILTTATDIPTLFQAGTGPNDQGVTKTRAKAEIWEKQADFDAEAKEMETVARSIVAAVSANDNAALGAALGEAGQSCKGCHDNFRAPPAPGGG